MLTDLPRSVLYQTARLAEQVCPFGVAFWATAACLGAVATPIHGLDALALVAFGVLAVAYFLGVALAAHRVRIATQLPTLRPAGDLRDEVEL
ncbi:hypothetical protein SAMN06269185_3298 [Natronoarchaeum philippinense]|uniref:Uncharacterized protein n=1 Tax=Natronoarchaeum philippinense TaxID=558529 RepID=A0A285P8Z3_NATPI|nr:hypothetical protein [Natronoarchaeum philippinense]SNZ18219.1 hypothetical protein SAMN06269185_3298 [Natronoarchaeum philippinense]